MKKVLLKAIAFTIVIGILALAFNTAFGNQTITYLHKEQITILNTHFYIWKMDFWSYAQNIQLSTTDLSILRFDMPTRQWITEVSIDNWWTVFVNNLALMLDYVIMIINILLYPLKVGAYLIRNIMAILGINTNTNDPHNGLAWLVYFVNNILANIQIPYV